MNKSEIDEMITGLLDMCYDFGSDLERLSELPLKELLLRIEGNRENGGYIYSLASEFNQIWSIIEDLQEELKEQNK